MRHLPCHDLIESLKGSSKIFLRKSRTAVELGFDFFLAIINVLWALPAAILLRFLKPFIQVKLGYIWGARIGHFIVDPAIYLNNIESTIYDSPVVHLFYISGKPANLQWKKMISRRLIISPFVKYLTLYSSFLPNHNEYSLPVPSLSGDGYDMTLINSKVGFEFSNDEILLAKNWLYKRGWAEGEPFVCLHVRDSAYLETIAKRGEDYSYHSYRDTDISSYVDAIKYLLELGYWVIRMGKVAHERVPYNHKKLIDYPFSNDQSDLVDVWISANCRFYISTSSGPVMWPAIYGKPIVFVNALPLNAGLFWAYRIWVPKNLYWKNTGKSLTLSEYYLYSFGETDSYTEAGISISNLSPLEILLAVMECEQRISGIFLESRYDIAIQELYLQVSFNSPNFSKAYSNKNFNPNARAGTSWLKSKGIDFLK